MKKLLATLLMLPTLAFGDVSGSMGMYSDYLFRGESQTMGSSSLQGWLQLEKNGLYGGAWVGQVDGIGDANYEYDLFGGYMLNLTDKLWVDVGVIQYRYDDKMVDKVEEWYVKGGNHWISMAVWTDMNDHEMNYKEVNLMMPFITWVDVVVRHGVRWDDSTYQMLTVSKDMKGWTLGMEVLDTARHGQFTDSAAFFVAKNF